MRRCAAYVAAGADGVFVPGLAALDAAPALAGALDAPLNVLYSPAHDHTYVRLADAGTRRISLGSLLYRAALGHAVDLAWSIAHGMPVSTSTPVPGYGDVRA